MQIEPISATEGRIVIAQVHEHLRQRILDGTMPPGSVLSQVQLAKQFGVSRTPLREALRLLQEERLVVAEHNHRVRVADINLQEVPHAREVAEAEHAAILAACRERDLDAAVELLARHLARTALTVVTQVAPEYEPTAVRTALRLVTGKANSASLTERRQVASWLYAPMPAEPAVPDTQISRDEEDNKQDEQ